MIMLFLQKYEKKRNKMDKNVDYLIIGGGPSGLSLANKLKGKTLILEKENEVGGLAVLSKLMKVYLILEVILSYSSS